MRRGGRDEAHPPRPGCARLRGAAGRALIGLMAVALWGCADDDGLPLGGAGEGEAAGRKAIYGSDDRSDLHQHSDEALVNLARNAAVALIPKAYVDERDPGAIAVTGTSLGERMSLCEGERFAHQVSAARCSGTLIDDDLVLTAGHCVPDLASCRELRLVFDFHYGRGGELAQITSDDVYRCYDVLVSRVDEMNDWAIVRLDRPATPGHRPAPMRRLEMPLVKGEGVAMVGFSAGLPVKLDAGGVVMDSSKEALGFFHATVDAFRGNSGSAIYDSELRLTGVLSGGAQDFVMTEDGCQALARYASQGVVGERIGYAQRAVQTLCAYGFDQPRLCDATPRCGDQTCEADEVERCPADCGGVPERWLCAPAFYGTGDGCDCDCGVRDPDCEDQAQPLYNCEAGMGCNVFGQCRLRLRTQAEPKLEGSGSASVVSDPAAGCSVVGARGGEGGAPVGAWLLGALGVGWVVRGARRQAGR